MVETRSTSNNTVPKMSTNSSDSLDETMLTQQSIGTSTAIKSNEEKRLETSKLMIENDIMLHIDYMLSEIEASDDLESLNEMKEDIRAMQQKLETIIFELLNFVELDEQDQMSRDFSRLKIDIKRTFTLLREQVKEVNTRNQQEMTASDPDSKKTIVYDDNIMPHQQQQPGLNFFCDDSVMNKLIHLIPLQRPLEALLPLVQVVLHPVVQLTMTTQRLPF